MMFNAADFESFARSEAFKRQLEAVESGKAADAKEDEECGDLENTEDLEKDERLENGESSENGSTAEYDEDLAVNEGEEGCDRFEEEVGSHEKALPYIAPHGETDERPDDNEEDETFDEGNEGSEEDSTEKGRETHLEKRERKKPSSKKRKKKVTFKPGRKKLLIAILAIAVFLILYFVLHGMGAAGRLKDAKEAEAKGEYAKAAKLYNSIEDSEESKARLSDLVKKRPELSVYNCKEGDSILLGAIDQDANSNNGREAIEWIVLEKSEAEVLLISKYCLDLKPFSDEGETDASWEGSAMRRWLNTNFYNEIFTLNERDLVASTKKSGNSIAVDTPGEKDTDKIFLLDAKQAEKYFPTEEDRKCALTQSAKKGANISGDDAMSWWWLCTRDGKQTKTVSMVDATGSLNVDIELSPDNKGGVRPVIVIKLVP